MEKIYFRCYASGKYHQMGRIIRHLCDSTISEFQKLGYEEAEDSVANRDELFIDRRITADGGLISSVIVGLIFFIPGWFAKKALDEIYGEEATRIIKALLEKSGRNDSTSKFENFEYQNIFCGAPNEPTVVIRVAVDNNSVFADILKDMEVAYNHAITWINTNGGKANIHCHTISNGSCNIEPVFYSSLEALNQSNLLKNTRKW
jgi:hypothetical protein